MDPHPRQLALVLEDLDTWPVMTLFGKGTPTPKTAASSGYCDRADKSGIETQEREGNEPPFRLSQRCRLPRRLMPLMPEILLLAGPNGTGGPDAACPRDKSERIVKKVGDLSPSC